MPEREREKREREREREREKEGTTTIIERYSKRVIIKIEFCHNLDRTEQITIPASCSQHMMDPLHLSFTP